MNDSMNGNPGAPGLNMEAVPVSVNLVRCLSDLLARAQRGEIHSMVGVAANSVNGGSSDVMVVNDAMGAVVCLGALGIARLKLEKALLDQQAQTTSGRIIRAPAGAVPTPPQ